MFLKWKMEIKSETQRGKNAWIPSHDAEKRHTQIL